MRCRSTLGMFGVVIVIYLAALGDPVTAYGERYVYFFNATTCGEYAQDRKLPKSIGRNGVDEAYVAGWLSAANFYVAGVNVPTTNGMLDNVMLWLDNYCFAHSFSSLQDGLLQFVQERSEKANPQR